MKENAIANIDLDECLIKSACEKLMALGKDCYLRGWSLATSSNYSILISKSPPLLLMTASGKDKGNLKNSDFVILEAETGSIIRAGLADQKQDEPLKKSAETDLHLVLAKDFNAGAVIHTHSIWASLLSEKHAYKGKISFQGYEILKALHGVNTHEVEIDLPIFQNSQNIKVLADLVKSSKDRISHGFLLQGHGLYTWGKSFEEAKTHLEALEFLLELKGRQGESA